MEIKLLPSSDLPVEAKVSCRKRRNHSLYNGKFTLRTDVKSLPDLTLRMAFLNEYFYNCKDVFFIRFSTTITAPEQFYRSFTALFRKLNNGRWRKEPIAGFRICNVVQQIDRWRFTSNIACTGSRYAAMVFEALAKSSRAGKPYLFISFHRPRKTLEDRAYKGYYTEFYEKSHMLHSQAKISMLEPYYWRIETGDIPFVVQMLFDIYGPRLKCIYTDYFNGVEISQTPNIDPDDYFATDRHRCGCRVRFFQPFGTFFKLLNR